MSKIEFRPQDLIITETKDGTEVVNIKGSLAFDEDFIREMAGYGVKKVVSMEEEEETGETVDN